MKPQTFFNACITALLTNSDFPIAVGYEEGLLVKEFQILRSDFDPRTWPEEVNSLSVFANVDCELFEELWETVDRDTLGVKASGRA